MARVGLPENIHAWMELSKFHVIERKECLPSSDIESSMKAKLILGAWLLAATVSCHHDSSTATANGMAGEGNLLPHENPPIAPVELPSPPAAPAPSVSPQCGKQVLKRIGGTDIYQLDSSKTICFKTGMFIDADGSPNAYCPDNKGLDATANAGGPGNWYGIVTDQAKKPVLQQAGDPHPGCYISPTSLADKNLAATNPLKYVDAEKIPYIALPGALLTAAGIKLGDFAFVKNKATGKSSYAIFADGGPGGKIGEGSIYLAQQLGIPNTSPRNGGATGDILYIVFPGTGMGNGTLRSLEAIQQEGQKALDRLGGDAFVDCLGL
jgi:hypothetical protein